MANITTSQFKKGIFIEYKGEPHQIVDMQFVNPGKGGAFIRTKLKSVKTGRVQDFTFKSGESAVEVPINTREMQYLYKQGSDYVFMDNFNYEQFNVAESMISEYEKFLKPNDTYQMLVHEEDIVGIRFPKKARLLVTEAEEGARGNTVSGGGNKTVVVETGLTVSVPLFIKKGDTLAIDTETGEYVERA